MNYSLKNKVKEAYETVPLYYNLLQKCGLDIESILNQNDWNAIPIIDKKQIIEQGQSILTPEGIMQSYQGKLIHVRTSGSTGEYMDIYWKHHDYTNSMLPLWWGRYHYYNIRPSDKLCFFNTLHPQGKDEDIHSKNSLGFSKSNLTEIRMKQIYEKMLEFQPKWLLLQPSIAILLCQCKEKFHLPPLLTLTYIELSGELLKEEVRQRLKQNFNCQIANQYGANEFNSIAYECPCGKLHVMESNVLVESIPHVSGNSELLITTKTNSVMPLIRYRIGDYGEIVQNEICECGNRSPVLKLTLGRTNDWIYCKNDEKINAYVFVRAMDYVNYLMEGSVKQFQIMQTDFDQFEVHVVLEDDEDLPEIENLFLEGILEERLKNADYKFVCQERLMIDERSGKLACIKDIRNHLY